MLKSSVFIICSLLMVLMLYVTYHVRAKSNFEVVISVPKTTFTTNETIKINTKFINHTHHFIKANHLAAAAIPLEIFDSKGELVLTSPKISFLSLKEVTIFPYFQYSHNPTHEIKISKPGVYTIVGKIEVISQDSKQIVSNSIDVNINQGGE